MSDFDDFNPYTSPVEQAPMPAEDAPPETTIPGWLIVAFGMISMMIPFALSQNIQLEDLADDITLPLMIDSLIYGLPAAVATFIFGIRNLRRGIDSGLSIIGCSLAIVGVVLAIYFGISKLT